LEVGQHQTERLDTLDTTPIFMGIVFALKDVTSFVDSLLAIVDEVTTVYQF
jgi:hypothetical protein